MFSTGCDAAARVCAEVHGFLDTIREGRPETPLVLISPIFCGIHEETPGLGAFDPSSFGRGQVKLVTTGDPAGVPAGQLTLRVIRESLASLVERRAEDANVYFLDEPEYGAADAVEHPLPDALHPDSATHQLIGAVREICVCKGGAEWLRSPKTGTVAMKTNPPAFP